MLICNCQTTKRNTRNSRLFTVQKCCSFSEPKPVHNLEIVFEKKFPENRFARMPDYSKTVFRELVDLGQEFPGHVDVQLGAGRHPFAAAGEELP